MRINSSAIGMESARNYRAVETTSNSFMVREFTANIKEQLGRNQSDFSEEKELENTEEDKTGDILDNWQNVFRFPINRVNESRNGDTEEYTIKQLSIRYIFQLLFARRKEHMQDLMDRYNIQPVNNANVQAPQSLNNTQMTVKTLQYTSNYYREEYEETSFSSQGKVVTADGREINFNIDVAMSREFVETMSIDMDAESITLCDPLVINLEGDVANVSDQKFYFDIDSDGEEDEISKLFGSGFLALDKNNDGTINNGSELFGTASGDGFRDLAMYDEDGNGWIDENDSVFEKLKIWCMNEDGSTSLYTLKEKGLGAIGLFNSDTDFKLQSSDGNANAFIRKTGIFLYENGSVGTVQHVDMCKTQ